MDPPTPCCPNAACPAKGLVDRGRGTDPPRVPFAVQDPRRRDESGGDGDIGTTGDANESAVRPQDQGVSSEC